MRQFFTAPMGILPEVWYTKSMNIQLSDHFDYKRLLLFALPSICMMIFMSIYSVVDGFFVSNFVGKVPFAAINFIMPILVILGSIGTVFGTGGSALIAKTLGEGEREKANELFSLFIILPASLGILVTIVGQILLPYLVSAMGAEGELFEYCIRYGRISLLTMGAFMMQYAFQSLFITAEKPHLGFVFTVGAGLCNMVLDALFIIVFEWGIEGAALATGISELLGGLAPCIYFGRKNSSLLHFAKPVFDLKSIKKAITNGLSEFVSSISMSVVGILYNIQLLHYAGEDGVAAYGVIMYVNFIFLAIMIGYTISTSPVISYHYGAQNHEELHNLFRRSLILMCTFSIVLFAAAQLLAAPCAVIFVGYDTELKAMTVNAFRIYAVSFLLCGFNIFGSSFFTALNNGLISAVISFMRTLVFETGAVLLLPLIFGLNGIWSAIIVAEIAALVLTMFFIVYKRKDYHY